MEIRTQSHDAGDVEDNVDADYGGEEMTIAFNPSFLIDGIAAVPGVEVVLEMGDRLREPVQPPYDELLIDPTGVHVLDQGGRCEGALGHLMGDAIGSRPPAYVQRDPRLHSGSVSHLFSLQGSRPSFENVSCSLGSRQRAPQNVQVSWLKLEKLACLPGVLGQAQNF